MSAAIERFLDNAQYQQGKAANTLKAYKGDLLQLQAFLEIEQIPFEPAAIDHKVFRQCMGWLGVGNRSLARKRACWSSFFKYLCIHEGWPSNPVRLVATPRYSRPLPRWHPYSEIKLLLAAPDDSPKGKRDRAILELLFATGIRVGELVAIDLRDLYLEQRQVLIYGKGKKQRLEPFGKHAAAKLEGWIKVRKKRTKALFLSLHGPGTGSRISARSIERNVLKKYGKQVGLETWPHKFRHSYATILHDRGMKERELQELLGHENLTTTMQYVHASPEHVMKVYKKAHPKA